MEAWLYSQPLSTGAAAVFPFDEALVEHFTARSRFDDDYPMYRVRGKTIAVPRNLAQLGKQDLRDRGTEYAFTSNLVPKDKEQERVIAKSTKLLLNGDSFVTQAPTGFGKTWVAMQVIANVGRRTGVVVTKEDLRDEWMKVAKAVLGLKDNEIGLIQGDHCDIGKPFTVALIQSVSRFHRYPPATFKGIGLWIFDEVHRLAADVFSNASFILPGYLRWGLSATPKRSDGKEALIDAAIGPVRVVTTKKYLTPIVYRVHTKVKFPKMTQVPGRMAHFDRILAANLRRNHTIARFVKLCYERKRRIIVFATAKRHLTNLHEAFEKIGIPASDMAYYVGGLTKQGREAATEKAVLLATYAYTAEATNIPWLDTLVMATPRADVVQIVGRILREWEGKKVPAILEIVDPLRMYRNYATRREEFYTSIGAEIRKVSYD